MDDNERHGLEQINERALREQAELDAHSGYRRHYSSKEGGDIYDDAWRTAKARQDMIRQAQSYSSEPSVSADTGSSSPVSSSIGKQSKSPPPPKRRIPFFGNFDSKAAKLNKEADDVFEGAGNKSPNYAKALQLYEKAAALNEPGQSGWAHFRIGKIFIQGLLGSVDAERAHRHFLKAKELGDAGAYAVLGFYLANGVLFPQNLTGAADLFEQGAELNCQNCAYEISQCYFEGTGRPRDFSKATMWLKRAADLGNPQALAMLGDS